MIVNTVKIGTGCVNKEKLKRVLLSDRRMGAMSCASMKVIYEIIDECEEVTCEIPEPAPAPIEITYAETNGTN